MRKFCLRDKMDLTMMSQSVERRQAMRMRRQLGFQRLNQLSFMQIITSCPLFIAGVVTLVMALPHVDYPVFNFGPVFVSILVFPMALIGLLATRKATENLNEIETTGAVRCMIMCNFVLSILCSLLTGVSSFYSFYIIEQCSDTSSEYYELCLPNSRANVGLSLVDGIVCLILLVLSVLGIVHFCTHGLKLCFDADSLKAEVKLNVVLPVQTAGHSGLSTKAGLSAGNSGQVAGNPGQSTKPGLAVGNSSQAVGHFGQ